MKTFIKTLALLLSIFLFNSQNTNAQCHIDDWTALKALYESTNGVNWINRSGWDILIANRNNPPTDCHLSDLFGVSTNGNGRVSCLDLDGVENCGYSPNSTGNNLNGFLPAEIGLLSGLGLLVLDNNTLSGSIPAEIGQLSNLEWLSLYFNELSGTIPAELCYLTNLYELVISENDLEGCYPDFLRTSIFCEMSDGPGWNWCYGISDGNNFDATGRDFCTDGTGTCSSTEVYPGDLNNDGIVNHVDIGLIGLYAYETGHSRAVEHQNNEWYAHPASNWTRQHLNNEDIKHFDCNGNGIIDANDHQAVFDNIGQIWNEPFLALQSPQQSDYQLMLLPAAQVIDGYLFLNISLERRGSGDLTVQGGYFTLDYSQITSTISFVTLGLNEESWLGIRNENLFYEIKELPIQKKIEVGFTKTNGISSIGNGIIGQLIISYNTNQARLQEDFDDMQEIRLSNIGVHNGSNFTAIEDEICTVFTGLVDCQSNWEIYEDIPFQNNYKSNSNITTNGFVLIGSGQKIEYQANNIQLNSGFRVKVGAEFTAEIQACE